MPDVTTPGLFPDPIPPSPPKATPADLAALLDFRYNTRELTNMKRTALAAKGIQGKRLTYKQTSPREARA